MKRVQKKLQKKVQQETTRKKAISILKLRRNSESRTMMTMHVTPTLLQLQYPSHSPSIQMITRMRTMMRRR